MAAPILELADEVKSQLATATGYAFTRRNKPFVKRDDIVDGKWFVVPAGEETATAARQVDKSTLTVDVAYQRALPAPSTDNPDPAENQTWFDNEMAIVENVKNCFRPEGSLRDASFLEFKFLRMTNTPIYRPEHLHEYAIFTAVIRLEFVGEIEAV